jgi:uncharacterized protein YukE
MTAYEVKLDAVPAATGALTTAEITGILTRLDPTALQDAGAAQTQLGRELAAMAAHLAQEAGTLAQNWSGNAARTALAQFQRLHQQTATLATQASQTGDVLTWLGTQVLPAFQHPATPAQARDHLTNLTAALLQADTALPATIGTPATPRTGAGLSTTSPRITVSPRTTVSHSSPVILTGTTSHSAPASPIGTPLAPGPAHPTSPVSSLQSAAPVPNAGPSAATTTVPAPAPSPPPSPAPAPIPSAIPLANVPATSGTTVASDVTSDATPTTAEVAPAPPTPVTAIKSGAATPHDPSDDHQAQPAPATTASNPHAAPTSALPSLPGTPIAAPAPEVSTTSPALSARPLPELPTLDSATLNSDLSGGAFPLPPQPATPAAINPIGAATAPATHSFLPPAPGVATPPSQERHRDSWATEDRNPWGLPADCVPPLIEGA